MKIHGLMANVKLVKSFTLSAKGELQKSAYPNACNFASMDFGTDLHLAVRLMAGHGGCLLKGELDRDLDNESRAGHTSPSKKTGWICLDLDGITAWDHVEDFLNAMGCG